MKPEDQEIFLKLADGDLLGLILYLEARGEPIEGRVAVGWVVRNRTIQRKKTYKEIILTPATFGYEQFSCLNTNDSNYYIGVNMAKDFASNKMPEDFTGLLQESRWLAHGVVNSSIRDNVRKANHYYNPKLCSPKWAKTMAITRRIGNHIFLRGD